MLSKAANGAALRQHFKSIRSLYGHVHAVSLVEKTGPESVIGSAYHEHVGALNQDSVPADAVGFSWFDFHKICRGMRFENVSRLFAEIGEVLDGFGYSKIVDGSNGGTEVQRRQGGILRTNCMDCLDRTNVVQSAAARRALAAQLATLNITLDASPSTDWFNILWADNGDAISKQYASSAALKGDFTRTNRRTLAGALTDFSFTVTRYFTNVISDFFTQAAIDFLLGNVTAQVFSDFEAEMVSGDPAVSVRRVRQNAIEVSAKIVVADEREAVLAGWTVLAPRMSVVGGGADEGRTVRGGRMGEVVVLLTERAVYRCEFDWEMEKVSAFERVKLRDIHHIQWGITLLLLLLIFPGLVQNTFTHPHCRHLHHIDAGRLAHGPRTQRRPCPALPHIGRRHRARQHTVSALHLLARPCQRRRRRAHSLLLAAHHSRAHLPRTTLPTVSHLAHLHIFGPAASGPQVLGLQDAAGRFLICRGCRSVVV